MRTKVGTVWGRWLVGGSMALGFAACGGNLTHGDAASNGGHTSVPTGNGGSGNAESLVDAGGRNGSGGRPRSDPPSTQPPSAAQGGKGGASFPSFAGETSEGGNFCGGCGVEQIHVVCVDHGISDIINLGAPIDASVDNPCEAVNQRYAADHPGGAGGDDAGNGGAGGSPSTPSICDTYVAPGYVVLGTDECTATEITTRIGTCTIAGQCCVMVNYEYCGI